MQNFRYNRFTGHADNSFGELFEMHGHCWGQRDGNDNAGAYCLEISNNKLFKAKDSYGLLLKTRGGRSYVYNNQLYDPGWSRNAMIRYWTQEVTTSCNNTPCAVEAHQHMGLHPVPLPAGWLCTSYPCPMQVNNSYIWGNTWDSGTITVDPDWVDAAGYVLENRDYWDDLGADDSDFNAGLSSARPSTCAEHDSYWETDTERLYRCVQTNTWELVYEAYAYPHPLSLESHPTTPENLRIMK